MTLSTRSLKVISGAGVMAVCGVSGLVVATNQRPADAPLRPPVTGSSSNTTGLVIPPSCGKIGAGASGSTAATLDPALMAVVEQLRETKTASARRAILATLSPSDRLEVEAYVRARRRNGKGSDRSCGGKGGGAADPGESIAPSVIDAPPSTQPLINTYVS